LVAIGAHLLTGCKVELAQVIAEGGTPVSIMVDTECDSREMVDLTYRLACTRLHPARQARREWRYRVI